VTSATATSPLRRARALADEVLRPAAEQVDQTVVPRSHLDAWGAAGLLGLAGPPGSTAGRRRAGGRARGGGGAGRGLRRTWFVATQHALPSPR
jgi:hypothetical protein